ncbi:TetR/AcrR family transcriptional regulator [Ruania zhangjianzhongii]|uniref:TetR/AcrR family transcriptional regulator n=1 Tax=Ruania zhangjianzhongii TaxID=2603206 RepID=UPI0011CC8B0B|nr:TetR/AcrR family transcriptional regulator [Ruania zhangjianzhongii]
MVTDTSPGRGGAGRALAQLWGVTPAARPGPKPKLSIDAIVDAALGIARSDGLAAVTMQRVAEAAGCAKMALYRHVSDRSDLLAAALDTALGEPPALLGGWRERFAILWEGLADLYRRDAWLLDLPPDLDALTPRNVAWIDAGLSLFDTTGLSSGERWGLVLLITENARFVARQQRSAGSPIDDLDRLLLTTASAGAQLPAARYPHVARAAAAVRCDPETIGSAGLVREAMVRAIAIYFPPEVP